MKEKLRDAKIPTILLLIVIIILVSCVGGDEPPAANETAVSQKTNLNYLVTTDGSPQVKVSGSEFEVLTNNCGSRVSALESFSRSREFNVAFSVEFSESIRGQLGGDVIVANAEIEAAVGIKLGALVGSTEAVRVERQIETPADSITIVTLRWEEIWQTGQVSISDSNGASIGVVPFRLLTSLRLSQTGIQDMPCGTLTIPAPEENGIPAEAATTSAPINTLAPSPTPSPTPSSTPRATDTPQPQVNEIHEISAYTTALGRSYNTGIYIQAGDNVRISYTSGQWWIGQDSRSPYCNGMGDSQDPTDADGYLGREGDRVEAMISCSNPNMCKPLLSAPWGSLLGSIGENGGLFYIGKELDFIAQDTGVLYLRINYYNHNAVTGCPYGDGGKISTRVIVQYP